MESNFDRAEGICDVIWWETYKSGHAHCLPVKFKLKASPVMTDRHVTFDHFQRVPPLSLLLLIFQRLIPSLRRVSDDLA